MTYSLLLVDDEVHAIEGVKSDLDVVKLNISHVFTAYSSKKAKEIFENEHIDMMICDIEMPRGNGLDLMRWVREHSPHTATIFLTSHADFKYAKEALQLGSLEYLLKPVKAADLENAIHKAQSAIDRNSQFNRYTQSHQLWVKNHSLIIEHFWLHLINHTGPLNPGSIREQIERHHIPVAEQTKYVPILISVHRWHKAVNRSDEKILEYALKNIAEEIVIGSRSNGFCFSLDRGKIVVILPEDGKDDDEYERLQQAGEQYVDACNRYFYCDLSYYCGRFVLLREMANMVAELRAQDDNNVAMENKVHFYQVASPRARELELPHWTMLASLLKSGSREAVIQQVRDSLEGLVRNGELDARALRQFNQVFAQVLYSYLTERGIQANQLLGGDDSMLLSSKADRSVTDTLAWVEYAVLKSIKQTEAVQKSDSVVDAVIHYIQHNIDQELTRDKAAEYVFLHPDHLTRIFKRQTGHSVTEYILMERMKLAKELLVQTNIPVSAISSSVGYSNFSHFTRTFKKFTGIGPTEYRRSRQSQPSS